jgi:RNA polymerase sigma factor for flagellar operon FliA
MQGLSTSSNARLTAAQAESLWRAWTTKKDSAARDRLVLSYSPMVKYLAARKVRELPDHCELDDLVSSGLVALLEAVDRFDPAKGATFEQYAWTRVSGSIMDELRRQDWASRSVRRLGRKIERARDAWYVKTGTTPTDEELAGELQISLLELREGLEEIERAEVLSLNAPAHGTDEALPVEVGDTVEALLGEFDPEGAALKRERVAVMRDAIASLGEREREILALVNVHEVPGAEIGRMLGVTESRVSQILAGIRRKLHNQLDPYDAAGVAAA